MTHKATFVGALALTGGLVAACHDNSYQQPPTPTPTPTPSQSMSLSLDTAQVLALARQTSESSSPLAVDGGALTLNDTSETSGPIAVNAM